MVLEYQGDRVTPHFGRIAPLGALVDVVPAAGHMRKRSVFFKLVLAASAAPEFLGSGVRVVVCKSLTRNLLASV